MTDFCIDVVNLFLEQLLNKIHIDFERSFFDRLFFNYCIFSLFLKVKLLHEIVKHYEVVLNFSKAMIDLIFEPKHVRTAHSN
jgi:hypothetical protein